jgi:hypothetical protein
MTHINAYVAAVEKAKHNVLVAKSELADAERQLAEKKVELGVSEPSNSDENAKGNDELDQKEEAQEGERLSEGSVEPKSDRRKGKK